MGTFHVWRCALQNGWLNRIGRGKNDGEPYSSLSLSHSCFQPHISLARTVPSTPNLPTLYPPIFLYLSTLSILVASFFVYICIVRVLTYMLRVCRVMYDFFPLSHARKSRNLSSSPPPSFVQAQWFKGLKHTQLSICLIFLDMVGNLRKRLCLWLCDSRC